jgi:DNA-binding HxlR family transcriptional regulator
VKTYNQYCPVAHALDVVGERWALLVVRELVHGPLRYSDLHARLGGCSSNVLADRLRGLEAAGVVDRRRLPPPAASTVYELTDTGLALRPVLAALARWGARTLGPPAPDATLPQGWLESALRMTAAATAPDECVAFRCGDESASLIDGEARAGLAPEAVATVIGDPVGLYHLLVEGELGGVSVEGDAGAVRRFVETNAMTP